MNLGDSNLKSVNTSRPQLVHSDSKQSITASDDYYSLASEASSSDEPRTDRRYETPPMHTRSADASRDALQSEATIPPLRPIKHKDPADSSLDAVQAEATIPPLRPIKNRYPVDGEPAIAINRDNTVRRKPVSRASSEGTIIRRPIDEISPPTPGVDDTPYIQFAIDQLTRDEEVVGPRHRGAGSEASYPVDRIIPDQGLGYVGSRQQRQPPGPTGRRPDSPLTNDVLLPAEPTTQIFRYPKLNFAPRPLRFLSLCALLICCLLMIAGLLFCAIWPTSHDGLWQYDGVGTSRYFVFEYLPTLLAIVIIIWLFVIQCAIHRIFPYLVLSSGRSTHNSGILHDLTLFPTNHLIPNLSFFKYQEPLLGLCSVIFWLSLFTVPLQSCLFQTRYYAQEGLEIWRWTAVQPIAWTLFALYLLLMIALLLLLFQFAFRQTGLKWDPVCLADILTLVHRSNFLSDFDGSETGRTALTGQSSKALRLGYWMTWRRAADTFYGIGEENAPVRRYSSEEGKTNPLTEPSGFDLEGQRPIKSSSFDGLQRDIYNPVMRYRWLPWFLRDGFVVLWIVIAFVLMIAFIVVSFVDKAVQKGFSPDLPAPTTSEGFSPADFLYSFIPSLVGMILFLLWQPIDMYFRALQPFANLADTRGTSAELSLLLDYMACLPIEVTLRAMVAGHYKVAWTSFISLISITLPILGGGVFTAQFVVSLQDVRIAASMPGYYALVVFVIIYALSFLTIWPTRKRHLPHNISTLGQLISFIYQSRLLADVAFREPRSKIDLVTKLLAVPVSENRYAFGVYIGLDGKEHLGIDRLAASGSKKLLVTTGTVR